VADELGTAVLRIEVDDGQARDQLRALRKEIEQAGRVVGRGTRSRRGGADPEEEGIDRQTLRRFNLRGFNAVLRSAAQDIESIRTARRVNLGSSWTKALATISETKTDIDSVASAKKLNINSSWTKFLAQLQETKADIDRAAGTGRRAGIRDGRPQGRPETRPRPGRTSRLSGALSSGIIGAGFPLLFGQGVGASVGGGLGGVGGGALGGGFGFALSIVGTAVGAAFDEALNKGKALATGLQDPINQLGALTDASLLSSKGVEEQAQGLIAVGREAEAAALIQRDLAQSFGDISGLTTLTESYDKLARTFGALSITTAQFVEGPLTTFLDRLRASLTLSPERQIQIARKADDIVRQELGPFGGTGFVGTIQLEFEGQTFKGSSTGVRQDLITFLSRQELEAREAAIPSVVTDPVKEQQREQLLRRQKVLIESQVDGYRKQALAAEFRISKDKEALDIENLVARKASDFEIDERKNTGLLERLRIEREFEAIKRTDLATEGQIAAQGKLALQAAQERIDIARQLAGVEQGVARSTLEQVLNIRASVAEAKRREQEIGAAIDAARLRGGDAGEAEAARLVIEQQKAAKDTELALVRGATALRDAGQQLSRDAKNAVLEFTRVRSDESGLNRFLSPAARARRAEEDRKLLLPQFREAQAQFTQLTGEGAPDFVGRSIAKGNEAIREFIAAVDREFNATQNLVQTTQALVQTNDKLTLAQQQLAEATAQLASKTWNVAVNVQGASGAQIVGDVVGALP
jgi:hypothetical protein